MSLTLYTVVPSSQLLRPFRIALDQNALELRYIFSLDRGVAETVGGIRSALTHVIFYHQTRTYIEDVAAGLVLQLRILLLANLHPLFYRKQNVHNMTLTRYVATSPFSLVGSHLHSLASALRFQRESRQPLEPIVLKDVPKPFRVLKVRTTLQPQPRSLFILLNHAIELRPVSSIFHNRSHLSRRRRSD